MMRHPRLNVVLTLSLLVVVAVTLVGIVAHAAPKARAAAATYATIGDQSLTNMTNDFYINGQWKTCLIFVASPRKRAVNSIAGKLATEDAIHQPNRDWGVG